MRGVHSGDGEGVLRAEDGTKTTGVMGQQKAVSHSPGPWRACKNGECRCGQVWTTAHDHPVATVIVGAWGDSWPEWRIGAGEQIEAFQARMDYGEVSAARAAANARLIAAAPDLLEALIEFADAFDHVPLNGDFERRQAARIKALAALAKAKSPTAAPADRAQSAALQTLPE